VQEAQPRSEAPRKARASILDASVQPHGYVSISARLTAVVVVLLGLAYVLVDQPARLHAEDGWIEWLSVGCWAIGLIVCLASLRRHDRPLDRMVFAWLAWLSLLAATRELDLHVLLNPQHLGALGVRYRLSWFLASDAGSALRVGWLALFVGLGLSLVAPLAALRHSIGHLARRGDTAIGLFALAIAGLVAGWACDDLLRGVGHVEVRQACEETCELLGSLFFLAAVWCLSRKPYSNRCQTKG
jgi:hypothetical protein